MKRIGTLLFILCLGLSLAHAEDNSQHLKCFVRCINYGEFACAAAEMPLVVDWDAFETNLDLVNASIFIEQVDTTLIEKRQLNALRLYVARMADSNRQQYANRGNYSEALTFAKLASQQYAKIYGENHPNYAISLNNFGNLYLSMGDYAKAEQYYRQALEIQKNTLGENHSNYTISLNNLGNLYKGMGDYAKAEQYYRQALEIRKNTLGENHPKYATSLNNLGNLYKSMGNYAKAEEYYLQALEIQKNTLEENHPDYAISLFNIGNVYYYKGDYAKAEKYLLQALDIRKKTIGENHPKHAASFNSLGNLYKSMGDYAKAEKYYLQALDIQKMTLGENHPDYAISLFNIGNVYYHMGDYAKAEEYYLRALDIRKKTLGESHPKYAASLNNLGNLYKSMGNYAKAEQYYRQALEIKKHTLGENHPDYATSLINLGNQSYAIGKYNKAEEYYLQALDIQKKALGENHPDYAISLFNIGNVYYHMGDYAKAEQYHLQALKIKRLTLGENHLDYAASLNNLGNLYKGIGDYTKAEQYHLQASKIWKTILGEYHPDYAMSLHNIGSLYVDIGKYDKAESFLLKSQLINKNLFIRSLDYMSESQRELYWATLTYRYEYIYPKFTYFYHWRKPEISSFAYNNELFTKGLLLSSSDYVLRSILESKDNTLINHWNELTTKKQQIIILEEKDPQSAYLEQLRKEAEQLEKTITQKSAAFRESQAMWNITWDSVRNRLSEEEVAIEYMSARLNDSSTMYCALLLRDDNKYPELIPLFEEKEVSSLISSSSENKISFTYSYDGNGEQLSKLVWSKVLPHIKPGETVYFAPSGMLHQIAIEALPYDSIHTIADMFNLVRLSSTREIVLNKSNPAHSTATLYGGIQYTMSEDEIIAESMQYSSSTLLASRGIENDTLNRGYIYYLPGTKKEVEIINNLLKDNNLTVQLFTSTTANEESFKAISGKHQHILHIATHGFYWSDSTAQKRDYFSQRILTDDNQSAPSVIDPLNRCGLLFAGAQTAWSGHSADLPEGVQDGILTAKEISLLDLRDADLVVLSACETGKGEITGEGVFGLQRAFKQAGAQTIIMSLWPVNDVATQLLMTEFYRNWITDRQSKREAFRSAQNAVRTAKDEKEQLLFEDPAYWAGFIMLD